MRRNKKLLTMVACILIFALAFIPVRRANAFVPAIPAAVYYAIAATGTAYGLYSMNKDSMDHFVNDYWSSASSFVKKEWEFLADYGYITGNIVVQENSGAWKSITSWINNNHATGAHTIYGPPKTETVSGLDGGTGCRKVAGWELVGPTYYETNKWGKKIYYWYITNNAGTRQSCDYLIDEDNLPGISGSGLFIDGSNRICLYLAYVAGGIWKTSYGFGMPRVTVTLPVEVEIPQKWEYVGDPGGYGAALEDPPEVYIPCPPVPAAEWPDRWADDLTDGMTGQGGQVIQGPIDWFKDKDTGKIIYFPPGDPPPEYDPKKHEKLVPPVPPVYDPVHPAPGEPGPATPEPAREPATEPCPYCPPNPDPGTNPCPNPYCPNNPDPVSPPVPASPGQPVEPCPYCPPNPDPGTNPCPNPYCPNNPDPVSPPYPSAPPVPDDRYIDFEPLKKLPHIFTTKFPFSLPWDLKRGIESLEGGQWDRKFQIAACGNFWPEMTVDVSMFDPIAGICRMVFLIVFDFGLIFATRRLMGGDV